MAIVTRFVCTLLTVLLRVCVDGWKLCGHNIDTPFGVRCGKEITHNKPIEGGVFEGLKLPAEKECGKGLYGYVYVFLGYV